MMVPTAEACCLHFLFEMVYFSHVILTEDIVAAGYHVTCSWSHAQSVVAEDGDPTSLLLVSSAASPARDLCASLTTESLARSLVLITGTT